MKRRGPLYFFLQIYARDDLAALLLSLGSSFCRQAEFL